MSDALTKNDLSYVVDLFKGKSQHCRRCWLSEEVSPIGSWATCTPYEYAHTCRVCTTFMSVPVQRALYDNPAWSNCYICEKTQVGFLEPDHCICEGVTARVHSLQGQGPQHDWPQELMHVYG